MGVLLSCCCPESEDGAIESDDGGYGQGGSSSDVAPLLGQGNSHLEDGWAGDGTGSAGNSFQQQHHHHQQQQHQSFLGGTSAGGAASHLTSVAAGLSAKSARVQQRLDEILQEAGRQVIDCGGGEGGGSNSAGSSSSNNNNNKNPHEKSVVYGKRLSSVSTVLASKHLGGGAGGGLWDTGGGHGAERMSRQPGELVLSEGDHLLVTEAMEESAPPSHPRRPSSSPPSLEVTSLHAFLDLLETECSMLVTLIMRDSPYWHKTKEALQDALRMLVDKTVRGPRAKSVRQKLFRGIISGRYPSVTVCNGHCPSSSSSGLRPRLGSTALDDDDDNEASNDLERIKHFGRRCSSPCCAGAFVVESMLSTVVHEELEELSLPADLGRLIYRRKPIRQFLFVDVPSVLFHYIRRLDQSEEEEEEEGDGEEESSRPALRTLELGSNLGSLDTQLVNEGILKSYVETKRYYDFPWRFSEHHSRASTDFLMLTLCRLFNRPADHFSHLTTIRLSGECLNTRINVLGDRGGQAVTQMMAGIAYSCPSLETLDLKMVSSLAPECLAYLFYQDAFSLLHKYAYLPRYSLDGAGNVTYGSSSGGEIAMHNSSVYCPWCDDLAAPNQVREGCEFYVGRTLRVLDDRLYDFVERMRGLDFEAALPAGEEPPGYLARHYLVFCVKVSHLLSALSDPVLELQRELADRLSFPDQGSRCKYAAKPLPGDGARAPLCETLRHLLLPMDVVDSKTWIIPLMLTAAPQIKSLGDCLAYEGLKLATDLRLQSHLPSPTSLEEVTLNFDHFTSSKVKEKVVRCMKSLLSEHAHWSIFSGQTAAFGTFSLKSWVENELDEVVDVSDVDTIKARWQKQVEEVTRLCPRLRSVKMSIQERVLCGADKEAIWGSFAKLESLSELQVHSSCWLDVLGLLEVVGTKVKKLSLMLIAPKTSRDDDISARAFVNTVPWLCPNLEDVRLGYQQHEAPHSLCTDPCYDLTSRYSSLVRFEANGNISLEALQFLWEGARSLETLTITGNVVSVSEETGAGTPALASSTEVVLTKERVQHLFSLNRMRRLRELDVNMTLSSIAAAQELLESLPADIESVATLNVKVCIPESLEGENFGDLVSSVLARMASFKSECQLHRGKIIWNWRREGILTILLQQQMLLSFSDLIDP